MGAATGVRDSHQLRAQLVGDRLIIELRFRKWFSQESLVGIRMKTRGPLKIHDQSHGRITADGFICLQRADCLESGKAAIERCMAWVNGDNEVVDATELD